MEEKQNKKGSQLIIGILMGLFLSVIGAVLGIVIYKDDQERKSFFIGWAIGFAIEVVLGVVLGIVFTKSAIDTANSVIDNAFSKMP